MKKTNKHPLTFFREANETRAKLVKKSMGGPGSGMGSMYLNDLANEAMMAEPSIPPVPSNNVMSPVRQAEKKRMSDKLRDTPPPPMTKPERKKGGAIRKKK